MRKVLATSRQLGWRTFLSLESWEDGMLAIFLKREARGSVLFQTKLVRLSSRKKRLAVSVSKRAFLL